MRTIVDLPDHQLEALKQLSRDEHLSRAELVRRAVSEYLERHRPAVEHEAFGLWKGRSDDGLRYQERLRREWSE